MLWEKEKELIVGWAENVEIQSYVGGFSPDGVYRNYEIKDGKFYGVGNKTNYLGNDTYYKLVDGFHSMKKLVYKESRQNYYGKEVLEFYVYTGTLAYEYD